MWILCEPDVCTFVPQRLYHTLALSDIDNGVQLAMVNPFRDVRNLRRSRRISVATYGGQRCEAVGCVKCEGPSATATHGEAGEVNAGEVNAEVWKHFVEQGGQNGWVPAIVIS